MQRNHKSNIVPRRTLGRLMPTRLTHKAGKEMNTQKANENVYDFHQKNVNLKDFDLDRRLSF